MSDAETNKRIIKNTFVLYFRQIVTMFVALFTSRIILQTLGVTDYGIHNVVGGVVAMLGFLSGTLANITQRFISVELGKGNQEKLQQIFFTSVVLHLVVCVIVIIIAETIGLWFLNNKLVIPVERMVAANWVYQFAVAGFILSILTVPFHALVISHEAMQIYGYMGIFDVVVRLITVYLLVIMPVDKLIIFAIFGFGVSCIVSFIYFFYCRKKYQETKFSFVYNKSLVKAISNFGVWVFLNSIFNILRSQGVNVMLNMFFGPTINAARGIAVMVETAVKSFSYNFRQALVPQLMKSYAADNKIYMWSLVESGTRLSYFLMFIFFVPVLLKTDFILKLWLGTVPEYAAIFTKLLLTDVLFSSIIDNLITINSATGKIKPFSICHYVNSTIILVIAYFLCMKGYTPQYVFVTPILVLPFYFTIVFIILKRQIELSISFFTQKVLIPIFLVSFISISPFYFFKNLFSESFFHSCVIIITSMIWTGIVVAFVGLRKSERIKAIVFLKQKFS